MNRPVPINDSITVPKDNWSSVVITMWLNPKCRKVGTINLWTWPFSKMSHGILIPNFCKVKMLMPRKKWGSSWPVVTQVWIKVAMKKASSIRQMKKMAEQNWNRGQKVNFHISKKFSVRGFFVGMSPWPGMKEKRFCCWAAWAAADYSWPSCSSAWRYLASAASLFRVSFSVWILDISE